MIKQSHIQISNRIDRLNQLIAIFIRISILLMLGLGLWNVIGRYLGITIGHNLSSNKLIEGQWYLFDCIFLLGLGWTLQKQGHVRVDILQANWSESLKAKIEIIGTLFLLLPFSIGVMLIAIEPAIHSWLIYESSPDPNGLGRYWIKSLIPIGFFLLSLQGISEIIKNQLKIKAIASMQKSKQVNDQEKGN